MIANTISKIKKEGFKKYFNNNVAFFDKKYYNHK